MTKRDIVVIGGSAGGIYALRVLVAELPPKLAATLFIVIHTAPESPGLLPEILASSGPLPATQAEHGQPVLPGRIYVAPPNRHLLVDADGTLRLTGGPKENRCRPAIDPLFRSAAQAFGSRVIGVLLSGGLDDGVAGLAAIKERGGFVVVQDPAEAEVASMPFNALCQVKVDQVRRVRDIGPLLSALSEGREQSTNRAHQSETMPSKELEIEVRLAGEQERFRADFLNLGTPSMLTCPECSGALLRLNDERVLRFRCHTDHAVTPQSLLAAVEERIEEALWSSVCALEERALLLGHIADHVASEEDVTAEDFHHASRETLRRAKAVRKVIGDGRGEVAHARPAHKGSGG